ncbi:MAG TPA: hypothetical protein VGU22_14400 [Methylomirabilota bacterium]|jgi:hypothetical protein|nr:hypothetical protein [Methylomirabilota bacterium]
MTMKSWRIAAVLALTAMAAWTLPARGQSLGVYDDFSSGQLDPVLWYGYEYVVDGTSTRAVAVGSGLIDYPSDEGFFGPKDLESTRGVIGGQAQITLASDKRSGFSSQYTQGAGRSGLRINHPALADHSPAITTLRATVKVAEASVPAVDCLGKQNAANAQLFGHFFNDGTSGGSADLTGDVQALVKLERRVESTTSGPVVRNVIEASLFRCNAADCRYIKPVAAATFARTWTVGASHVVAIVWRPGSNAFTFSVSGGGLSGESRTIGYTMADTVPPRGFAYDLRVETRGGFCGPAAPQRVSIDARYDNVQLDITAAAAAR